MNQDQIKEKLLSLSKDVEDFTVILTGKKSRKVNGLYYPDKKQILIHNKNFTEDNSMMYTAIHEFAHHVHFVQSPIPVSSKSHTNAFWVIFHNLLIDAEKKGLYGNIFKSSREFIDLTKDIKENYLSKNAEVMKGFGQLLIRAINLCQIHKVRFEDYIDREILINRSTADAMVKIHTMKINPELGFDNMRILSRVKDDDERKKFEKDLLSGKTQDMVKAEISNRNKPKDTKEILEKEKSRIETAIKRLKEKLDAIKEKIGKLK